MATENIHPRGYKEGNIGLKFLRWLCGYFAKLDVDNGNKSPVHTLQRETTYALNDVTFHSGINARYFLKCTTAGTTGSVEPDFSGVTSDSTVTDGTVVWTVKTLGAAEGFVEYLPLAGGTLTGALNGTAANFSGNMTVAGVITGNVTGNLTGNADTATNAGAAEKATKDGDGNIITVTYLPILNNAGAHNSIYRGKYLGDHVTDEQYDAIDAGTFEGLFIGDYWVINGINWRIAAFDYWLHCGDTECTTHHVVIVPDTNLATCQMNNSNVTTGAYIGSNYYTGANSNTGKATANTAINNAFGSSHILTHREHLQNAVTNGYESGGTWYDSKFELMTERMVYGCDIFHNTMNGTNIPNWYSIDKSQLPLFALEPSRITNRAYWWLRDVVSAASFALVNYGGNAHLGSASGSVGVRPAFAIKK